MRSAATPTCTSKWEAITWMSDQVEKTDRPNRAPEHSDGGTGKEWSAGQRCTWTIREWQELDSDGWGRRTQDGWKTNQVGRPNQETYAVEKGCGYHWVEEESRGRAQSEESWENAASEKASWNASHEWGNHDWKSAAANYEKLSRDAWRRYRQSGQYERSHSQWKAVTGAGSVCEAEQKTSSEASTGAESACEEVPSEEVGERGPE